LVYPLLASLRSETNAWGGSRGVGGSRSSPAARGRLVTRAPRTGVPHWVTSRGGVPTITALVVASVSCAGSEDARRGYWLWPPVRLQDAHHRALPHTAGFPFTRPANRPPASTTSVATSDDGHGHGRGNRVPGPRAPSPSALPRSPRAHRGRHAASPAGHGVLVISSFRAHGSERQEIDRDHAGHPAAVSASPRGFLGHDGRHPLAGTVATRCPMADGRQESGKRLVAHRPRLSPDSIPKRCVAPRLA
jgi:hypothetical protein